MELYTVKDKVYECAQCNLIVHSDYQIKKHLLNTYPDLYRKKYPNYACSDCPQLFTGLQPLNRHKKNDHNQIPDKTKVSKIKNPPRDFSTLFILVERYSAKRNQEHCYLCLLCRKKLYLKDSYTILRHEITSHPKEFREKCPDLACKYCEYLACYDSHLRAHMKRHRNEVIREILSPLAKSIPPLPTKSNVRKPEYHSPEIFSPHHLPGSKVKDSKTNSPDLLELPHSIQPSKNKRRKTIRTSSEIRLNENIYSSERSYPILKDKNLTPSNIFCSPSAISSLIPESNIVAQSVSAEELNKYPLPLKEACHSPEETKALIEPSIGTLPVLATSGNESTFFPKELVENKMIGEYSLEISNDIHSLGEIHSPTLRDLQDYLQFLE